MISLGLGLCDINGTRTIRSAREKSCVKQANATPCKSKLLLGLSDIAPFVRIPRDHPDPSKGFELKRNEKRQKAGKMESEQAFEGAFLGMMCYYPWTRTPFQTKWARIMMGAGGTKSRRSPQSSIFDCVAREPPCPVSQALPPPIHLSIPEPIPPQEPCHHWKYSSTCVPVPALRLALAAHNRTLATDKYSCTRK